MTKSPKWLSKILGKEAFHYKKHTAGIVLEDSLIFLRQIPDQSVDLVLTDPPYFIDKMGANWNREKLKISQGKAKVVGSMPVGMKFDPKQGIQLQAFLEDIFQECSRILKPGGFLVSFSQARLYHRLAMAAENSGFEIRDMFAWTYEGQAKAFSQDHFVKKMDLSEDQKNEILAKLGGRKTPQFKPMIEPMVFAQKPKEGTFVENWLKHSIGLIDTTVQWNGKFPGNVMNCAKPSEDERGVDNHHLTVKPQKVLQHIIEVLTPPGAVVVDPFAGSSSTQLAALKAGRHSIGCEREQEDFDTSKRRLAILTAKPDLQED